MPAQKVLIVEDDAHIRRLLRVALERAGYGVSEAGTAREGLSLVDIAKPDAVLLDLGGLWLLYRTPLLGWTHSHPAVHLLVHVHLVQAGYLLAAVLVGRDPLPHRRSPRHRAVALVAALAAHGILAKTLYAEPPAAVDAATAQAGAVVMYYAGDAVEVVMAVLLCRRWFGGGVRPAIEVRALPSG